MVCDDVERADLASINARAADRIPVLAPDDGAG
jgi:hypothetical protein